jgi:hypothetical protein
LWAGVCWWAIAVAATALDATSTERVVFDGRWVLVVVLGGYAQILWGSLAYLMPMLRGGDPERLSAVAAPAWGPATLVGWWLPHSGPSGRWSDGRGSSRRAARFIQQQLDKWRIVDRMVDVDERRMTDPMKFSPRLPL